MTMRFVTSALFAAAILGGALSPTPGAAQTPAPKKESELLAAGHKPQTGQEIIASVVGNTSYSLFLTPTGGTPAGAQITIFYRSAKVRVSVPSGGPGAGRKFESNWWIEGNFLCAEQRLVNTGHVCYSNYDVGSSIYSCVQPAGDCIFLSRIAPGNPDKI